MHMRRPAAVKLLRPTHYTIWVPVTLHFDADVSLRIPQKVRPPKQSWWVGYTEADDERARRDPVRSYIDVDTVCLCSQTSVVHDFKYGCQARTRGNLLISRECNGSNTYRQHSLK